MDQGLAPDMDSDQEEAVPMREPENPVFRVENATLDLDAYASSYSGPVKIQRLMFIGDHCDSLRIEAFKLALNHIKESTYNVQMYSSTYTKLSEALKACGQNPESVIGPLDTTWIEQRSKKGQLKLEKLDTDLKNYKSNSIKESIRRGHDDLGDHYMEMGDLNNALKCYSRSRDYCTSGKHVLNMCLNVVKVSIQLQNWSHVMTYVIKAEATAEFVPNSPTGTKFNCAAGLADLASRNFKNAAKRFLATNFDHFAGDSSDILSSNNIAVYAGLTALATYDRPELLKNIISSPGFKLFLELEPQLRDALNKFYCSQYAECLSILSSMKDNLLLDIYLAPHVNSLYSMIRCKALIQYFHPFSSADMNKMAAAFNTTVHELENELMNLILEGQIQVSINVHVSINPNT